jgi:CubicO group peptidase (beta-lactamase class C family)
MLFITNRKTMSRYPRQGALVPAIALLIASLSQYTSIATETPATSAGETVNGFDTQRLERLHDRLRGFVDSGEYAGIVSLLVRGGQVADAYVYGMRDVENKIPMRRDTIFRIYSQSKIISTVAAMILVEEGKIDLVDPVEKYLPQLSNREVMIGGTPDKPKLETAAHPFTVRELMTHTSGIIYGSGADAVHELWKRSHMWESKSLNELIDRIAVLPLAHDPGTTFEYGASVDVLGAVVEKVSGKPFEEFLRERIFQPLEMKDTSFTVETAKRNRLAKTYEHDSKGQFGGGGSHLGRRTGGHRAVARSRSILDGR